MFRRILILSLLACTAASAAKWEIAYFYDHARDVLVFSDIVFPTAQRGIAVGTIRDGLGERRERHVAMTTSDGGQHWAQVKLEDSPVSLFFLDDSTGWMVTARGVWKTAESGRSWTRLSRHKTGLVRRVWFLDSNHGFAIGAEKTMRETKDGGKTWKDVPVGPATGDSKMSVYTDITFLSPRVGTVVGAVIAPAGRSVPSRRGITLLQLETHDGGVTWKAAAGIGAGVPAAIEFSGENGLVLFTDAARRNPATHVYRIPLKSVKDMELVYQESSRYVTDLELFQGHSFLAAIDRPKTAGRDEIQGIPRRVHVLQSTDFKTWTEMPVDYQAEAADVIVGGSDAEHVFLATDTGMILRLVP